jgi:diguanylate cyclase (GGDEF)-like protein/PAS domain S-box-containing protein
MAQAAPSQDFSHLEVLRSGSVPLHGSRSLRVLFVHRDPEAIHSCLQELRKGQFIVYRDSVANWTQATECLRSQTYDLIVAEYLGLSSEGTSAWQLFRQAARDTPLIFLVASMPGEAFALLAAQGTFEYLQREHIAHLPIAIRRALNERKLRSDLAETEKALRHSLSLYRALVENPAYGICRCDAQGKLLAVNQAFLTMLGYDSFEELLAANRDPEFSLDLGLRMSLAGVSAHPPCGEPIEVEWRRKDGTLLKARLSGHDALDVHGHFNGCEIIAVDITEQRRLEEQLRLQASTDSLTGLVNRGHLLDVLHAEVARSKRTRREFSFVLLDLDGLKKINDQFGHLAGDRALCRLAQVLKDCCRSIDTAARYGGDEFAVVLPETGAAHTALVTRRISGLLDAQPEQPRVSVSVGIATYPADADGIGSLIQAADRALYAMKSLDPPFAAVPSSSAAKAHPVWQSHRASRRVFRRREAAQE